MSRNVSLNGQSYLVPDAGDTYPWAKGLANSKGLTDYLVAVANFSGFEAGVSASASGGAVTPDFTASPTFVITLDASATINNPAGTRPTGSRVLFLFKQDTTGYRTVTWGTSYKGVGIFMPRQGPSQGSAVEFVANGDGTLTLVSLQGIDLRQPLNAFDFGAVADWNGSTGTDNRPVFVQLLSTATTLGKSIRISAGSYFINNSVSGALTLPANITIEGAGPFSTILVISGSGFTNPTATYLTGTCMRGMEIQGRDTFGGAVGSHHAFQLYGVTNNCRWEDMYVFKFNGDAFNINKQTSGNGDNTACSNVCFEEVFTQCNGYGWNITGFINCTWNMCDINSPQSGAFRFSGADGFHSKATITGLWYEGTQVFSAATMCLIDSWPTGDVIFEGCVFNGDGAGTDIVQYTTNSANARFKSCTYSGSNWVNWINDVPGGITYSVATYGNHFDFLGGSLTVGSLLTTLVNETKGFIKAAAAQTADLWRNYNGSNNVVSGVDKNGMPFVLPANQTATPPANGYLTGPSLDTSAGKTVIEFRYKDGSGNQFFAVCPTGTVRQQQIAWDAGAGTIGYTPSGTWVIGDQIWESTPVSGSFLGSVCISGGTPGIWKTFAAIS